MASEANHAGALRPGCSHSVHFLLRQRCSSASPWLFRRHEEWIVDVTNGRGGDPGSLIPCGNELLNPWSSVPTAPNCFHRRSGALSARPGRASDVSVPQMSTAVAHLGIDLGPTGHISSVVAETDHDGRVLPPSAMASTLRPQPLVGPTTGCVRSRDCAKPHQELATLPLRRSQDGGAGLVSRSSSRTTPSSLRTHGVRPPTMLLAPVSSGVGPMSAVRSQGRIEDS